MEERRRRQRQAKGADPHHGIERHFAGQDRKVFLAPNESPTCTRCEGALKNAPVIGLVILSGLKKDGAEYTSGRILDPDSGKVYSSKIQLTDGGKKLNARLHWCLNARSLADLDASGISCLASTGNLSMQRQSYGKENVTRAVIVDRYRASAQRNLGDIVTLCSGGGQDIALAL